MKFISENYHLLYLSLLVLLLFLSWYFFQKSLFDERRKKTRLRLTNFRRIGQRYKSKLYNEEYEKIFRKNGLPSWITSERVNLIRFSIMFILLILMLFGVITAKNYISNVDLILWGSLSLLLTPKKPFPFYYVIKTYKQFYATKISMEVYQLYNDIKSNFQIEGGGAYNNYYIIQNALPYYKQIQVTLEKMLPHLEKKHLKNAWDLFEEELETKEAHMLAVIMREVESMNREQALLLLEQKRQEFSNHIYNHYTEKLRRKKTFIFALVLLGALTVAFNELTVFFMWYKEVMSNTNQFL